PGRPVEPSERHAERNDLPILDCRRWVQGFLLLHIFSGDHGCLAVEKLRVYQLPESRIVLLSDSLWAWTCPADSIPVTYLHRLMQSRRKSRYQRRRISIDHSSRSRTTHYGCVLEYRHDTNL